MLESQFQSKLIKELKKLFSGLHRDEKVTLDIYRAFLICLFCSMTNGLLWNV